MKLLMEGEREFILNFFAKQKKDAAGKPVWTSESDHIGRMKPQLSHVEVLVPTETPSGFPSCHLIKISRNDLFALVKKIADEELREFDEFID